MNFDVIMKINSIATGGRETLTRGEIASEAVDIKEITKFIIEDRAKRARAAYEALCADDTAKEYDLDSLTAEIEALKKAVDDAMSNNAEETVFEKMYGYVEKIFVTPPFEGMDDVALGIAEMCVFSVIEYFAVKKYGYDHGELRQKYWQSIDMRTMPGNADYWIEVFDRLQAIYGDLPLINCCQVAMFAMRNQNPDFFESLKKNAQHVDRPIDNAVVLFNLAEAYLGK